MNDTRGSLVDVVQPSNLKLQWTRPKDSGSPITSYTIYRRLAKDNGDKADWVEEKTVIKDVRSYTITLEAGKKYEIVVTANYDHGEAKKEDSKIQVVEVPAEVTPTTAISSSETCGCGTLHAAYGCVIAVLVLIIVAQFLLIFREKRGAPKHARLKCSTCSGKDIHMDRISSTSGMANPNMESPQTACQSSEPPSECMALIRTARSWELDRSNTNVIKIIGKGAFSRVGKATAVGIPGVRGQVTVAVKMLKENAPATDRKDLLGELELMKSFEPHPHVIKLLGCVTESEPPMVVIEYVPYGDLLGYLRRSRGLNDTYYKNPNIKPKSSLTSQQLMRFAWQVADGMNYLASKKIIHRDLAARNVLVGEREQCKVTDFGMARDVHQDEIYTKTSRGRLPVKWTAYESLLYGVYTTQSDVWSYGVLLYEIFTIGGCPYPNLDGRRIAARLQEGYRMPKPSHLEGNLYRIMTDCWEENSSDRPTFSELKQQMARMEKDHRTYINLKEYDSSLYANVDDLGEEKARK